MPMDLTRDNLHLSRPKMCDMSTSSPSAIDCKSPVLERVAGYVSNSVAENTRRAYLSDLTHFRRWGGPLRANAETVAAYLAIHADTLSVATLCRRIASLSKAHEVRGAPNPTRSPLVKATLQGIKRKRGTAQHEAKPLLRDELFFALDIMGKTLKDARDRALLLLGFGGGFRRSELAGIDRGDIELVRPGLIVHLRRSKTDQLGVGRKVGIPNGRSRHCPIAALESWLTRSGIGDGRCSDLSTVHGRMSGQRLSGEAISLVVKERLKAAGIDPAGYSGHSLRAGLATSAAQAGVSSWKIRQQTGHASDAMLTRYIRDGELFNGNAAAALL